MKANDLPISDSLRVYDNILQTIGKTPLVRLNRVGRELTCPLYAKVEYFNPGGSVKDRIALNIISEAERSKRLLPGGTVVESTSGNTGLGLAMVCAIKGYKSVFVMPDKMSQEKIQLLRAFGAKVVITPTAVEPEDPRSYYSVAKRIVAETPNAILANQYHNSENPRSHYLTTGPEIWEQTGGRITDLVACMGTGGTISGTARYLKEKNPKIQIVGVDPVGSILLEIWKNGGQIPEGVKAAPYKVEGFGEDFLPSTLDLSLIDDVIRVNDKEAFLWARRLVKEEGIFAGGSSGSALAAAVRHAQSLDRGNGRKAEERLVVVILPDSGSRYLSKFYDDKWMRENGFLEAEWNEVTLGEVLATKTFPGVISVSSYAHMKDVIILLKENDISQAPVLHTDGKVAGMITEANLLKHVLEAGHTHTSEETVAAILEPAPPSYPAHTSLSDVLPSFVAGPVVLVSDADRVVGLLTKIDVLDFIARTI
ncbi:MAG: cystathionine beta-synthase [Anaerolineae bacterium CG_4_9_14_0_8_um_filter_58_9]|nr:MAG: cystathionine beta-synthase [Anaerolineae bacterium CG_4_9_14_0_8_um_filter_58_9]